MITGIDAHHLGMQRTGNETYLYNLVMHLALLDHNGSRYVVYTDSPHHIKDLRSNPNFQTKKIPTSVPHLRFGAFYPLESWRKSFDVFHSAFSVPPWLRTPSVVTVYDLTFERFPEHFPRAERLRK